MDERRATLVMIPTYNEAENVETIVAGIAATGLDLDILFVDDNSPDGTGRILERLAADYPYLNILHRSRKQGLGRLTKLESAGPMSMVIPRWSRWILT